MIAGILQLYYKCKIILTNKNCIDKIKICKSILLFYTFSKDEIYINIQINFRKQEKDKKRGTRKNGKGWNRCGCTHTHTHTQVSL